MRSRLPAILAGVGIVLRIIPVWAQRTWYDENFSILLARLPLDRLISATAGDVHPPLWYLLCWPLAHIPFLPAWAVVRIPALLASIAAIWVWWLILQNMEKSPKVILIAFGLFCLIPNQIYYAQEGRMYSLLALLVLSAWLAILRRKWGWLFVATSLMLWLQNYGMIYAVALWVAALVRDICFWHTLFPEDTLRQKIEFYLLNLKPVTISLAFAGLTFIPWVLVLVHQMGEINGNYWIRAITFPSVLADFFQVYFSNGMLDANMLNFAVFYGVLAWVLIFLLRKKTLDAPTLVLAFLPVTLAAVVSVAWQPIMLFRALISSGAFLVLILAEAIEQMSKRQVMVMAIFALPALLVNLSGVAIRSVWAGNVLDMNTRIISEVDTNWRSGDLLYYADDGMYVTGAVSWKNIDNAMRVQPCAEVMGDLSQQTRLALGMRMGPVPENVTGRIWVISAETPLNPACENDYLIAHHLEDTEPVLCAQDNVLIKQCLYLMER
jgi:hypothetical protein